MKTTISISIKTVHEDGKNRYLILTESMSNLSELKLASRVHLNGKPIYKQTHTLDKGIPPEDIVQVDAQLRHYHAQTLKLVKSGDLSSKHKPTDFIDSARAFMRKRNYKKAYEVLKSAYAVHPNDPHVLTYLGSLTAIENADTAEGIRLCKRAVDIMEMKMPHGQGQHCAVFYLNLSRAYLASGDKKNAIHTLEQGAECETDDGLIQSEMAKLGVRKEPAVATLELSNPINKYIGKLLHRDEDE